MIPIVNLPYLAENNLQLDWISATSVKVKAGIGRDFTNTFDMDLAADITIDGSITGINGLDTGTLTLNKWYRVFVIWQQTKFSDVATIISESDIPTLPAGYDIYRRVGWLRTDASAHFNPFFQSGNGNIRIYEWLNNTDVLTGGAATSFTPVDMDGAVPPVNFMPVIFQAEITPNSAGNEISISRDSTSTKPISLSGSVGSVKQVAQISALCGVVSNKANIEYKVTNASDVAALRVHQFIDYI